MSPAELSRRITTATGKSVAPSTIGRWLRGANPDRDKAELAGIVFGDVPGALLAAGWLSPDAAAAVEVVQRDHGDDTAVIYVADLSPEDRAKAQRVIDTLFRSQ